MLSPNVSINGGAHPLTCFAQESQAPRETGEHHGPGRALCPTYDRCDRALCCTGRDGLDGEIRLFTIDRQVPPASVFIVAK